MSTVALVRIVIDGIDAKVYSPFDAKEIIKSMPDRKWSQADKCWIIPASDVGHLQAILKAVNYEVVTVGSAAPPLHRGDGLHDTERRRWEAERRTLEREKQRLQQEVIRLKNQTAASNRTWAEELFAKLSPEQTDKAYKALSRLLHPDVGGDTELMKVLNVARDSMSARAA